MPTGQIHGTISRGAGKIVMISFQTPPDLVLYSGARDSSKPGAAPPKGDITPGAVKRVEFAQRNGWFTGAQVGARKGRGAHWRLTPGKQKLDVTVPEGGEHVFFVWKGALEVTADGKTYRAGERDAIFVQGAAKLRAEGAAEGTEIIEIEAPAGSSK